MKSPRKLQQLSMLELYLLPKTYVNVISTLKFDLEEDKTFVRNPVSQLPKCCPLAPYPQPLNFILV